MQQSKVRPRVNANDGCGGNWMIGHHGTFALLLRLDCSLRLQRHTVLLFLMAFAFGFRD